MVAIVISVVSMQREVTSVSEMVSDYWMGIF